MDWLYVFVFAHIIPLASFVVNCRTFNQTHSHTKSTIVSPYRDVSFHMFDVKTLSFVCILLFVECEKFRAVLLRRKGKQKQRKKTHFPHNLTCVTFLIASLTLDDFQAILFSIFKWNIGNDSTHLRNKKFLFTQVNVEQTSGQNWLNPN